jgi:thiol peroxidase
VAAITLRGQAINTNGELPKVGESAPDFNLVNAKLQDKSLADFAGKKVLLNIVPSLDTPVCAKSTKRFNELAEGRDDVEMLMVSADLPFAQGRFCGVEKLKNVQPLSMMRSRRFAEDYGVLMVDGPLAGITARAVVVIDETGKVTYTELVADVANEPDYDAVMAAINE